MVRRERVVRVVRSLSHHIVPAITVGRLAHSRAHRRACLIARVVHVWSGELRTPLLLRRHVAVVRPSGWRHGRHSITGYKGLRLRVEGVPIEATGNRMLTLRVMGINIDRKSSKGIRYPCLRRRSSPRLVRALIERWWRWLLLWPAMLLLRRRLHRSTIRPRNH